jgi:glutamate dehydrogenase
MPVPKRLANGWTLEKIAAALPKDQSNPQLANFIHQYYHQVDEEDLVERSIPDLCGGALAHWKFWNQFEGVSPKLRIYNPQAERDGWKSERTIIEVVNDDMPFLVDSVTMEISRQGLMVYLTVHPVFRVNRDQNGELIELLSPCLDGIGRRESLMRLEVDRCADDSALQQLEAGILRVLDHVRKAVDDYGQMRSVVARLWAEIASSSLRHLTSELREEAKDFLDWLRAHNFIFLGFREHQLVRKQGVDILRLVPGSGLGILRVTNESDMSDSLAGAAPEIQRLASVKDLLVLTKANLRSTVHRSGYLDYVGIRRFNESGEVISECQLLGLYTFSAYSARVSEIPVLRRKLRNVISRSGFDPHGHMGKALLRVIEQYPRDELLQASEDELLDDARGIVSLGYRQRPRIFVRIDIYGRFVSCLVFLPRDRYSAELRERVQKILLKTLHGVSSDFTLYPSESALVRVHIIVHTKPGSLPDFDVLAIEKQIVHVTLRWQDELRLALNKESGGVLYRRYGEAFPRAYQDENPVPVAVENIEIIEQLLAGRKLGMRLYEDRQGQNSLRLRLFRLSESVPLTLILPKLEHMGVKVIEERNWEIRPDGGTPVHIHDFLMCYIGGSRIDLAEVRAAFEKSVLSVWFGEIEDDDFNQLVLRAALDCREVVILRAYSKFLRQTGFPFSQTYIEQALCNNPDVARMFIKLFLARFDPVAVAEAGATTLLVTSEIAHAIDHVESLDEDRILRRFLLLIRSTTRTNYFQWDRDGSPKSYLSLKINPAILPELPSPKPMFEIYVYSARIEGVHLRGGKVARGGVRWSDRLEDFRTEVLGLMKAQMVKNAVIVPVGAKGGFVVKRQFSDREALFREGEECYKMFLRGLLDLTDNLLAGNIVHPENVVRYDEDDPYLVVAADKGTSAFSDIANAVAAEYGFWLGDAFASGGSVGYDHKKMAITARGAWESVKRHFHELGLDPATHDFDVVGIGDMSGDVFGNGMLLSGHIHLRAAFDHHHIFLDPNPDPTASFKERERLFRLPRSSWSDYNRTLISEGGGVYARNLKSVTLSPQIRNFLGIADHTLTPGELIRAILKAPVDLLYNGGIGTYVKSDNESNADASDRVNDHVRVNGNELRCKVMVEGGNLGCTQKGRIEFALNGGRINTDAIDNSAGVDCSDHEVNIKILINSAIAEGGYSPEDRPELLVQMTSELEALVLRNNYVQAWRLAMRRVTNLESQQRFLRYLEKSGRLDRELEFLPSDDDLLVRKGTCAGFTSPERAIISAYSKMTLYDQLFASEVSEDPYVANTIALYFPSVLGERFRRQMDRHPLRREIIASQLTNEITNRIGSTFFYRVQEETQASAMDIVRAYLCARETFDVRSLWHQLEILNATIPHRGLLEIDCALERLLTRATLWYLRCGPLKSHLSETIRTFSSEIESFFERIHDYLSSDELANAESTEKVLLHHGVPLDLARRVGILDQVYCALDVIEIAKDTGLAVDDVAQIYFSVGLRFELAWLREQIESLATESLWQTTAKSALIDDAYDLQKLLTGLVATSGPSVHAQFELLGSGDSQWQKGMSRICRTLAEMRSTGNANIEMLTVAFRQLRDFAARAKTAEGLYAWPITNNGNQLTATANHKRELVPN